MPNYVKIEGFNGGDSGTGISKILFYDLKGVLIPLTPSDVVYYNANARTTDSDLSSLIRENAGSTPPYIDGKIINPLTYIIKIGDEYEGFSRLFVENWGNTSYNSSKISVSVSRDNVTYKKIEEQTVEVGAYYYFLKNFTFVSKRIILKSNNKTYSLKSSSGGRNEILTSNIGTTATASASSESATNRQAWRAFDGKAGNDNERWITSSGAPQWLKYSLINQAKVLEKYAVYAGGSRQPTAWTLEASNDDINWIELDKVSGLTDVTDYSLLYEKSLNLNESYYHYRLYITSALSSGYVELGELELYFKPSLEVFELKESSESNFINYGSEELILLNLPLYSKNYILQDTVSENIDGLLVQEIDRKPLSIKFE